MAGCACGDNWRVFLAQFRATDSLGNPRPVVSVDFVSLEFEKVDMEPGRGTVILLNRGENTDQVGSGEGVVIPGTLSYQQVQPFAATVFVQRIAGGGASPSEPVTMFGGLVESAQFNFDGTITLGFTEMDRYLDYRFLGVNASPVEDWVYTSDPQTFIAADLVNYVRGTNTVGPSPVDTSLAGTPRIFGVSNPNAPVNRDRTYLLADYKNLGEAVRQLTQVINGPVYEVTHEYVAGVWSTYITFSDVREPAGTATIYSDDVTSFDVSVDANEQANQVLGIGQEESEDGSGGQGYFIALATDTEQTPPFDTVQSWDDVSVLSTLEDHVEGYFATHSVPTGSANIVLTGLDFPDLDLLRPGYPIHTRVASQYLSVITEDAEPATIDRVSWSIGEVETVTIGVSALGLPIATQVPVQGCEGC